MDSIFLPSDDDIIALTRAWVDEAVIGLNLCPFAKAVQVKQQIRYVISHADQETDLQQDLTNELLHLHDSDPEILDTTLLILPRILQDFLDYNNFLDSADATLVEHKLEGEIQIASFHPDYQFAGTAVTDIDNYTNRSPFPILHLLRESSIDRAVESFPDASAIFDRNVATMRRLGLEGWNQLGFVVSKKQHQLSKKSC
ncbi:hypothetical protein FHW67_003615 [Herbaspirillum sp. Sphag1AN]|uniref:DUF1415 domain-containing protein n=1 Tax=unclassified Herbaspirillum TaxID=2624150 RepID=UPI001619C89D|nr:MULTISPECIES: DUF1415 domain-containing protein [unclassified Herbaspirillum]MBB3214300.1 hypothetical protein [Herbaspirillum sp. Sphag1AN]MBB3247352.1 hypothetical protein [Herbaspirillum sp. Sphag64]